MTRKLREIVSVRVSIVGVAEESLGTYTVVVDLDRMSEAEIGVEMAKGFRRALTPALIDFGPKLSKVWAAQPERIAEGDPE